MLYRTCFVLVVFAGAISAKRNTGGGYAPVPIPPEILPLILEMQNETIQAESMSHVLDLSVLRETLYPMSRVYSYVRSFFCSSSPASCSCGMKGSSRIAGGAPAGQKEWPWQVYLAINSAASCGGSLISDKWVITAAHCLYSSSQVFVIAGRYNSLTVSGHMTQATFTLHPQYDHGTKLNDIALVRLNTPAPLSSTIQPICLPYKYATKDFGGETATVIGWGATSDNIFGSATLSEVSMPVLNRTQCTTAPFQYSSSQVTDNTFCMYSQAGKGSCEGDAGGSVNWQNSDKVYLIGIPSWGLDCGRQNNPGVYTKITNYLDWIGNTAGQTFCTA